MRWLLLAGISLTISCVSSKKADKTGATSLPEVVPIFTPGPHAMVYRTAVDLLENVPVQLDAERENIVSYPHPSDLSVDGELRPPTLLSNGYLLDNKGIDQHVAFLNISYATYAELEQVPSMAELNGSILERNPLLELCDCGLRSAFTDVEAQLNQLIESGKLRSTCKVLK